MLVSALLVNRLQPYRKTISSLSEYIDIEYDCIPNFWGLDERRRSHNDGDARRTGRSRCHNEYGRVAGAVGNLCSNEMQLHVHISPAYEQELCLWCQTLWFGISSPHNTRCWRSPEGEENCYLNSMTDSRAYSSLKKKVSAFFSSSLR